MNNWISRLFSMGGRRSLLNRFERKRNGGGLMWGTLLGIGISAVARGIGNNSNEQNPLKNMMNKFETGNRGKKPQLAGLTEFSKELAPNQQSNADKNGAGENKNQKHSFESNKTDFSLEKMAKDPELAGLAEFSKELLSNQQLNENKSEAERNKSQKHSLENNKTDFNLEKMAKDPELAGLAEFSKELLSSQQSNVNKSGAERNNNQKDSLKNDKADFDLEKIAKDPELAGLAEFSKELVSNKNSGANK